jgi:hypothetical protein
VEQSTKLIGLVVKVEHRPEGCLASAHAFADQGCGWLAGTEARRVPTKDRVGSTLCEAPRGLSGQLSLCAARAARSRPFEVDDIAIQASRDLGPEVEREPKRVLSRCAYLVADVYLPLVSSDGHGPAVPCRWEESLVTVVLRCP